MKHSQLAALQKERAVVGNILAYNISFRIFTKKHEKNKKLF